MRRRSLRQLAEMICQAIHETEVLQERIQRMKRERDAIEPQMQKLACEIVRRFVPKGNGGTTIAMEGVYLRLSNEGGKSSITLFRG
jgi:hypothetical protein